MPPPLTRFIRASLVALLLATGLIAQPDGARRNFDIVAENAVPMLKRFTAQSGEQLLYSVDAVEGVQLNEVRGSFTAREALERMVRGTPLRVAVDRRNGALTLVRANGDRDPNAPRAVLSRVRPANPTAADDGAPLELEALEVTGSRLRQTDVEGFAPVMTFDRTFIENSGFATTEEFMRVLPQNFTTSISGRAGVPNDTVPGVRTPGQSGAGLYGLGANNTLVLIDGQRMPLAANGSASTVPPQGFYDLNTIPLGMIEKIEVLTDGASAIYGSDATGGVINIILKKAYNETEARARIGGTEHGGAFERGGTLTHGFTYGKLRGTVVLDWFNREALFAAQREFARTADQRPNGGSDFRTSTGSPVRIFALPGQVLNGLFNPNGTPATNAIAPAGRIGVGLAVADFAPTAGQANTVRYDTSHLQALVHPTDRRAVSSSLSYRWNERAVLSAQVSYSEDTTDVFNVPQATQSPTGTAVNGFIPAANPFNPFGQTLGFTLLHEEMGPRLTASATDSLRVTLGATVDLPGKWQVQANTQFSTQRLRTANPVLSVALMQAALNRTDPATALNLFGDPRAGRGNRSGIYESIFPLTIETSKSDLYTAQAFARGPLWTLPAGDIEAATGIEWQQQDRIRSTNVPSIVLPARSRFTRDTHAAFAELSVPVVNPREPRLLVRKLDLQLAGRYEDIEGAGDTLNPKVGVRWQPWRPLLLRASFSTGFRAPAPSEFEQPESTGNQTITDPRLSRQYLVTVITGSNRELEPETSETWNFGAMLNVPKVTGLSLGFDYSHKEQDNLTASLSAQALVNNEAIFPQRIFRGAPGAGATLGDIQVVDASFINFGFVRTETVDFTVNYEVPWQQFGRFAVRASASWFRDYNQLLAPGGTTGDDNLTGSSSSFPTELRGNAMVFWNQGDFGATLMCFYNGGFRQFNLDVASSTTFDLNVSWHWRRLGLRLQGGVGNIFDRAPPWVNTALGYQVGSQPGPKQRSYHASITRSF